MKTVGDFKQAGLVFVGDDKLRSETNNHDSDEICMSRCWLGHGIYRGFLEVSDCYFANKEWVISSFAWRENTGVKPEFKGLIDVLVGDDKNSEQFNCINARDLVWDTNPLSRVIKWRPSLNQPQQWPDNSRIDIIGQNGNDGMHYDNTAQQVEALAVNDKPIFTQAMADNGGFESGQKVYVAQINTLAGIAEKRYFVEQFWCGSGHQREYLSLGILFGSKEQAERKCKSLLGIDTRTDRQKMHEQIHSIMTDDSGRFMKFSELPDYTIESYDKLIDTFGLLKC